MALERSARGTPGDQFGDTVIEAQEPEWPQVLEGAEALLARTRDLRVAMIWTRAATHVRGFEGFGAGIALIEGLLTNLWDSVHPQLDAEDNDDPTMRLNALVGLVDPAGLLTDLRSARIGPQRGSVSLRVRDVELALGKVEPLPDETVADEESLRAAMGELASSAPQSAAAIRSADVSVAAIAAFLDAKLGSALAPDLQPLRRLTRLVAGSVAAPGSDTGADIGVNDSGTSVEQGASGNLGGGKGPIASREDALRALDRVCEWLSRTEPSNPAPLLIRRAQRLMKMNFLEIVRDMAPDSVDQVLRLVGTDDR